MKLKTIYIIGLLTILLSACGSTYEYWDILKFNIDNNALEDSEEIKLLYTSRGSDSNRNLEYYIHLIVVSQKTGDTVNVLTTADNGITMSDKDKVFNFFDQDNLGTKLLQMDLNKIKDFKDIEDINKMEFKKIKNVARDPNYDYIADNNYPSIIGSIGTMTNINEK